MKLKLADISKFIFSFDVEGSKIAYLYADFNVINLLYEKSLDMPERILLYYDAALVRFALRYLLGKKKIKRNVSTDFLNNLLKEAIRKQKNVFFFGDKDEVLNELSVKLKRDGLRICGIHEGYNFSSGDVVRKINASGCDILFVGLSAGKQEKWIADNFQKINSPLTLSTGGWFRLLAGKTKRAPRLMIKVNLEWLYKLISDFPRVWKRYFIGAPKFIHRTIFTSKIKMQIDE